MMSLKSGKHHCLISVLISLLLRAGVLPCLLMLCTQRHPTLPTLPRELGGCMAPIWNKYFDECRSVMYVLDATNPSKVPAAVDQLLSLLVHPSLKVRQVREL